MGFQPAFLITEDIAKSLDKNAIRGRRYEDLTQDANPWEIEFDQFLQAREKIASIENQIRQSFPDIVCVCTEKGIFWLDNDGFKEFVNTLDKDIQAKQKENGQVLWKWTTYEVSSTHLNNLRMLIIASAHDLVLLGELKQALGRNHSLMQREFTQSERSVWQMIEKTRDQIKDFELCSDQSVMMFERALITQEMLNRGEVSLDDLGYTADDLKKVQEILERHMQLQLDMTANHTRAAYNDSKESLRRGETTHLTRSTRWDMTFALIEELPEAFRNQWTYFSKERKRISNIVMAREGELGKSDEGSKALVESEHMEEENPDIVAVLEGTPEQESEKVEVKGEETSTKKKKKDYHRMAVLERRRP